MDEILFKQMIALNKVKINQDVYICCFSDLKALNIEAVNNLIEFYGINWKAGPEFEKVHQGIKAAKARAMEELKLKQQSKEEETKPKDGKEATPPQ